MRVSDRGVLYELCKAYVRTVNTRQDLVILDPKADLEQHYDKLTNHIARIEEEIQKIVNDGDVE